MLKGGGFQENGQDDKRTGRKRQSSFNKVKRNEFNARYETKIKTHAGGEIPTKRES